MSAGGAGARSTCREILPVLAALAFAAWCGVCRAESAPAGARPNILVLLSDDHCYRDLGVAGNRTVQTPHLDQLAADGVYFSHCFTPMPQCSPSRAAIFTGQDCWTNGVKTGSDRFAADAILWPQLLAEAGYAVFVAGKWHNADLPWECGFNAGANLKIGGMDDHRSLPLIQWKQSAGDEVAATEFSSTAFADAFLEFLQDRDRAQPFCAYVSFTAPHDPWVPPAPYDAMYDPAAIRLPKNFMSKPPFRTPAAFAELRDQQTLPYPRTERDVQNGMAKYYGMISHLDHEIARMLSGLEEAGLAENTLVIFAADHGYSLGSHGFVGKQCMYEEGLRLPLIVRYPPAQRGAAVCGALVSLTDFYPTICEVAGLKTPAAVEGRSLLAWYRGESPAWRGEVFASHHSPAKHGMSTQCVRTDRYKLIQHKLTGEEELFDLDDDPWERVNLADREELGSVRKELAARLANWSAPHELTLAPSANPHEADE